ncbi:membrane fusion protein (multidrug efflux system) [Humitalea rosea]|uniref:Membrane fusion protein (Multidrug efflux system) n=1 Tax=Humitalea rosea TaxID=990373 RepID=A0A2W7IR35_9PROT|nr:efflux RND transporter periplasmic adaptor subunit [Humitalea rosea]PZW48431.1 membrane fusion protein (multidrug efflux system) [Humitalea rosea]
MSFRPLSRMVAVALALGLASPALAQFGPQGPPAVGVVTAEQRPVTESVEFVGRVEAVDRVELRARVTGFLQERVFTEGQEVAVGDVLFRMERAPFEAELARQRANLAAAEATLVNARIVLERGRDLLRTPAGTQARVDDATANERSAAAQVAAARANVRVAEINLAYTEITAPIAGKIGRSTFAVGNTVGPTSEALATIVSQDPMRIAFPVSQRQGLELRDRYQDRGGVAALVVRVRLSDGRIYGTQGRVDFIDNQIDRSTDTILIRASVANPVRPGASDRELIDGQFVTVFVEGVEPVLAIVIPRAAVLQDQGGSYVFIVDAEKKAQRRNIKLGRSTPETAVVEDGLAVGDMVISEGIQRVRPGQVVNAAPVAAPAAPAARPAGGRG